MYVCVCVCGWEGGGEGGGKLNLYHLFVIFMWQLGSFLSTILVTHYLVTEHQCVVLMNTHTILGADVHTYTAH